MDSRFARRDRCLQIESLEGRIALSGAGLGAAGGGGPVLAGKPTPGSSVQPFDTNGDGVPDLKILIVDSDGDRKADTVGIDLKGSGDLSPGGFFDQCAVMKVSLKPHDGAPAATDGGLRIKITCHPLGGGPVEEHEYVAFDRNGDGDCDDPEEFLEV